MTCHLYKFECLSSLHVGSGEANYNIIDNEVERDPITGNSVVHASGLKGALRKHFETKLKADVVNRIFGNPTTADQVGAGTYKFFDAKMLSRPMRVAGSLPSVSVTELSILEAYLKQRTDFGLAFPGIRSLPSIDFGDNAFMTNASSAEISAVEDENTGRLTGDMNCITDILGTDKFALAKKFNAYPLPVVAHNKLENGISKQLWYEEYVPAGSVFTFLMITPSDTVELPLESELIQIGANASIGYGFIKFTKLA